MKSGFIKHIVYLQKKREAIEKEWQAENTPEKKEARASRVTPRQRKPRLYRHEALAVYVPPAKRSSSAVSEEAAPKGSDSDLITPAPTAHMGSSEAGVVGTEMTATMQAGEELAAEIAKKTENLSMTMPTPTQTTIAPTPMAATTAAIMRASLETKAPAPRGAAVAAVKLFAAAIPTTCSAGRAVPVAAKDKVLIYIYSFLSEHSLCFDVTDFGIPKSCLLLAFSKHKISIFIIQFISLYLFKVTKKREHKGGQASGNKFKREQSNDGEDCSMPQQLSRQGRPLRHQQQSQPQPQSQPLSQSQSQSQSQLQPPKQQLHPEKEQQNSHAPTTTIQGPEGRKAAHQAKQLYVPRHRRPVLARLDVEVSPGKMEALMVHEGDDVVSVVKMFAARVHLKDEYVLPLIDMANKAKVNE